MKDHEEPLKEFQTAYTMNLVEPTTYKAENFVFERVVYLEPNEFTDMTDPVGLFETEYEPSRYLLPGSKETTTEKVVESTNDARARYPDRPNSALPSSQALFALGQKQHVYERSKYTLFTLIGDLGGFLGAVVLVPS